jgi:hypothetical protein
MGDWVDLTSCVVGGLGGFMGFMGFCMCVCVCVMFGGGVVVQ